MKRTRIAVVGTAVVVLPVMVGGFMLQRREATDAARLFAQVFATEPDVSAVFGSYDASPPARGIVSEYRNLLHHYVHQTSGGLATTFWAGLGAVRREAFVAVDGFDDWRFRSPSSFSPSPAGMTKVR